MVLPLSLALMGLSGCNVYDRWSGTEFNAGPVDVINFPAEYLGTDGNRQIAGAGHFKARKAMAGEQPVEYFLFSLSTTQRSNITAALNNDDETDDQKVALGLRGTKTNAPTPSAYVFDSCKAPAGYTYDLERDGVNMGEQGVVFTRLPAATYTAGATATYAYVPIVSRVQVTSKGVACQQLKSEESVVASREVEVPLTAPINGKMVGIPDSTYHAYAVIDPGAGVYHADGKTPETGLGIQKWGWYNQYMLAYIDGGEVPITVDGNKVSMRTQRIYYPASKVTVPTEDDEGNPTTEDINVRVGGGYDVLEATRGQPGYSPVCEVFTYSTGAASTPENLPKSAAEIEQNYGATIKAVGGTGAYVYCLQAERQTE
jgi:hypothetical protein